MIPKLDKANARNICAYINVKFYTNSVKNVKYHENLWLCQIKIEVWQTGIGIGVDTWTLLDTKNLGAISRPEKLN